MDPFSRTNSTFSSLDYEAADQYTADCKSFENERLLADNRRQQRDAKRQTLQKEWDKYKHETATFFEREVENPAAWHGARFPRSAHDFDYTRPLQKMNADNALSKTLLPRLPESQQYITELPLSELKALRSYLNGKPGERQGRKRVRPSTSEITQRNNTLRRNPRDLDIVTSMLPKVTRRMRRAIANAPLLQKELVVYRGTALDRGHGSAPLLEQVLPSFISTSLAFEVANSFTATAEYKKWHAIRMPAGTPFLHFQKQGPNMFPEQEVLLYGTLHPLMTVPHPAHTNTTLQFSTYEPASPPLSSSTVSPQSSLSPLAENEAAGIVITTDLPTALLVPQKRRPQRPTHKRMKLE